MLSPTRRRFSVTASSTNENNHTTNASSSTARSSTLYSPPREPYPTNSSSVIVSSISQHHATLRRSNNSESTGMMSPPSSDKRRLHSPPRTPTSPIVVRAAQLANRSPSPRALVVGQSTRTVKTTINATTSASQLRPITASATPTGTTAAVLREQSIRQREEYEAKVLEALHKTCRFRFVSVGASTRETGRPYLTVQERGRPHRLVYVDTRYASYNVRDVVVDEMRRIMQRDEEGAVVAGGLIVVSAQSGKITEAARDRVHVENILFVSDEKNLAFSLGRALDAIFEAHTRQTTPHAIGMFGGEGVVNLSAAEEKQTDNNFYGGSDRMRATTPRRPLFRS
eukprot:PhM_4_TR5213/c0_g1_i1/m.87217